jgi:hypothetical protein
MRLLAQRRIADEAQSPAPILLLQREQACPLRFTWPFERIQTNPDLFAATKRPLR